MKCKAQRNAMQCRVRCGFAGGRSLSKQQLLKVIQTHNLLLPPLSFLAAAIFSIRPIIPLKGLLNKFFSSTTQSSVDYTLICYFAALVVLPKVVHTSWRQIVHNCSDLTSNAASCFGSDFASGIVDQIVGPAAKFWGVVLPAVPTRRQQLLGRVGAR